jgi:hypothetical protein
VKQQDSIDVLLGGIVDNPQRALFPPPRPRTFRVSFDALSGIGSGG